jgi:hypothetical protein
MTKLISVIGLTISVLFLSCQNNGNEPENQIIDPPEHKCIGLWQGGIGGESLMGLLPRDILIDVKINNDKDSTYSLISTYAPGVDTSMKHLGTWHLNTKGDSIILVGNDCRVIDTIQKKLVVRDCGAPIPIYINIQNNTWKVLMTDLLPVAKTLSIDVSNPLIAAFASQFEVDLEKSSQ